MKRRSPDFYLTSAGEGGTLARPRACYARPFISDGKRDDLMVVDIDPPVEERVFGEPVSNSSSRRVSRGGRCANRATGRSRSTSCASRTFRRPVVLVPPDQIRVLAWAELFQTGAEAETLFRQYHGRDRIDILMEESGEPEDNLKKWLGWKFASNPAVERAYLVRAQHTAARTSSMVLLVIVQASKQDLRAVEEASSVFSGLFGAKEHLDMTIYDAAQAARIPKWVHPFYVKGAAPPAGAARTG